MATVTLKGNPITTLADLPAVGSQAPAFTLTGAGLADVKLADFAGFSPSLTSVWMGQYFPKCTGLKTCACGTLR